MTFLRSYFIKRTSKGWENRPKEIIELQCDNCNKIYDCPDVYRTRAKNSKLHFCTKECSIISATNGELKNKIHEAILDKYGSFYVETDKFKTEQEELCLQLYGVRSRLEAPEILDKIKETCLERYGKETYTGTDDHKSKIDFQEVSRKGWITKIKNGSCSKSKVEEKVYNILVEKFGIKSVERQVFIIRQWVDFYIKSIECYLQVDGTYWHGLNRSLDIISLQKTSQDEKIYKQILRDQRLNEHMKNNNLKLIRITDEQVNSMSDNEILDFILKGN